MSKRVYRGIPLDCTYQAFDERPAANSTESETSDSDTAMSNSETPTTSVSDRTGTTIDVVDNDNGTETTTWLPSHLDADELTDKQQGIIEAAMAMPDATQEQLADAAGCSVGYPPMVLRQFEVDHNSLEDTAEEEEEETGRSETADEEGDEELSETSAQVLALADDYPNATLTGLADAADVTTQTIRRQLKHHRPDHRAINRSRAEQGALGGVTNEATYDPLRPYATSSLTPHDDPDADEGDGDTEDEQADIVEAQFNTEAFEPIEGTPPDGPRLADVRETAGIIARTSGDEAVVRALQEVYEQAGGEGDVREQ